MFGCFGKRRAERKLRNAKMKTLWDGLLTPEGEARKSPEAKKAIAYCEYCILEYEQLFQDNETKWYFWQTVIILGGVVATLEGVAAIPESWALASHLKGFGWLRGVPAGIVTVASALLSSFTYREDTVRFEVTGNILSNELVKYLGRAKPYNSSDEAKDTSYFVNRISELVETELKGWRTLVGASQTRASS
jgi:hypothetical protein